MAKITARKNSTRPKRSIYVQFIENWSENKQDEEGQIRVNY